MDRVMPVYPPLSKSNAAGRSGNMQMRCKCGESLEKGRFFYVDVVMEMHRNTHTFTHRKGCAGMWLDRWIGQRMKGG